MKQKKMSFVNVGARTSENFTVSVFHSGASEIDVTLQYPLIPGDSQDWLVGISSLTAPLDSTRFLDEAHGELFMLCRLKDGEPFTPENYLLVNETVAGYPGVYSTMGGAGPIGAPVEVLDVNVATWTQDAIGRLRHDRTPALEFGDLLEQVNAWVGKINSQIRRKGLNKVDNATYAPGLPHIPANLTGGSPNDYFQQTWEIEALPDSAVNRKKKAWRHLMVRVSPSGMLSVIGSSLFWSCFFIRVSPYMQQLTGYPEFLSVNVDGVAAVRSSPTRDDGFGGLEMDSAHVQWQEANADWQNNYAVTSNRSLWGSADTRLSISLSTSLPVQRSLTITDEKQVRDFTLGTFALSNEVSVVNQVEDQFMSDFEIQSQSRAGHVELKKPGAPNYWIALKPSLDIRQLRLGLMIRERVWSESTKKWRVVHRKLPINEWQTWSAVLIFAKKTH